MDFSAARLEITRARQARANNNEGMARVCSRRAAGFAIREYLLQKHHLETGLTLNSLLLDVNVRERLPVEIAVVLDHMTTRVNENYQLPAEVDLIADAEYLMNKLDQDQGENND